VTVSQTPSGLCKCSLRVRKPSTADRTANVFRLGFFHAYTKTATVTNHNIQGITGKPRRN
ncbi:MAG: hypothetical protein K2H85_04570, partial [Allobaculum sp.]|nr:hypothetical protein [Allobaculum sp.]